MLCLCLMLGMCACGNTTASNTENTKDAHASYIGVWETTNTKYGDAFPMSIQLFSNGKAVFLNTDSYSVANAPWAFGAEWMVEGDQLVLFYSYDGSEDFPYDQAYIFTIQSDEQITLPRLDIVYTKK